MSDLHCRPKGERAIPSHLAVPVRSAEWSEVQERAARRDLLDQIELGAVGRQNRQPSLGGREVPCLGVGHEEARFGDRPQQHAIVPAHTVPANLASHCTGSVIRT